MQQKLSITQVITLFIFCIFTIFQFLSGDFETLLLVDFRIIFVALVYFAFSFALLVSRKISVELIAAVAFMITGGVFLLYMYFFMYNPGNFSIHNVSIYQMTFITLASISVVGGEYLYRRDQGIDRLLAHALLAFAAVFLLMTISDLALPKPRHFDVVGIAIVSIFALMTVAGSTGTYAFLCNKNKASNFFSVVYFCVAIGGLFFCLLSLNNVVYNGCYPDAPIACPCTIRNEHIADTTMHDTLPPPRVDTTQTEISKVPMHHSETMTITAGGSLCGSLNMSLQEALVFAKDNNLKVLKRHGKTIVIVCPGDMFEKINNVWIKK